jgi:hypothetical protein
MLPEGAERTEIEQTRVKFMDQITAGQNSSGSSGGGGGGADAPTSPAPRNTEQPGATTAARPPMATGSGWAAMFEDKLSLLRSFAFFWFVLLQALFSELSLQHEPPRFAFDASTPNTAIRSFHTLWQNDICT